MKDILIGSLKLGGTTLLEYFDKPLREMQKESQSSIVTEADLKSDSVISEFLSSRFPEHNILSEESGFRNNNSKFTWVIDPLDGTSNFAAGIPWFGVLVTLFQNNVPVMAGAYLPVFDTIYFAEKDKGAFRNDMKLDKTRNTSIKNSLIAFSVDFSEDEEFLDRGLSFYKFIIKHSRNIRSTNSLVDFIYVAEGKFGGCINLFTRIWDISGLGLLISETGGIMKDISGEEIQYEIDNHAMNRNYPVICGTENVLGLLEKFTSNK